MSGVNVRLVPVDYCGNSNFMASSGRTDSSGKVKLETIGFIYKDNIGPHSCFKVIVSIGGKEAFNQGVFDACLVETSIYLNP